MSGRRHRLHRKMTRGRSLIFDGDDLCAIEQGFDIAAFEKPRLVPAVERRFTRGVDRIISNEWSSDGKDRHPQVHSLVYRKSVVLGKGVAGRVDLGGRRIIKKK